MKKISSKKLQLRSSIIAYLAGPNLRIVHGGSGFDTDGCGGGGDDGVTTDGAGANSFVDNNGKRQPCNITITTITAGC